MINEISERLDHPGRNQSDLHFSRPGTSPFITPRFSLQRGGPDPNLAPYAHHLPDQGPAQEFESPLQHPDPTGAADRLLPASGMKNEQIAEELHISIYTVRTHIANIYKKFEVNNKVDLLMHLQPILKDQTTPP